MISKEDVGFQKIKSLLSDIVRFAFKFCLSCDSEPHHSCSGQAFVEVLSLIAVHCIGRNATFVRSSYKRCVSFFPSSLFALVIDFGFFKGFSRYNAFKSSWFLYP